MGISKSLYRNPQSPPYLIFGTHQKRDASVDLFFTTFSNGGGGGGGGGGSWKKQKMFKLANYLIIFVIDCS